jgi:hypothetical protein
MNLESNVAGHYAHGALAQAIDRALVAAGKDPERLTPADLGPIDEFHIGGGEATAALFAQLGLQAGMRWLDIGSGLGGSASSRASISPRNMSRSPAISRAGSASRGGSISARAARWPCPSPMLASMAPLCCMWA